MMSCHAGDTPKDSVESDVVSVSTTSTTSPSFSEIAGNRRADSKRHQLTAWRRRRQEKKKLEKRQERKQKNKISKDDFYNKSQEFRAWLLEYKELQFDSLSPAKAKDLFKKFVKKWNTKKLAKGYYRGVDAMWAAGTPEGQNNWAMPRDVTVTPGSVTEEALVTKHSRASKRTFSTFGKKSGAAAAEWLGENAAGSDGKHPSDAENEPGRKRHRTDNGRTTSVARPAKQSHGTVTGVRQPWSPTHYRCRNTMPLENLFDFANVKTPKESQI